MDTTHSGSPETMEMTWESRQLRPEKMCHAGHRDVRLRTEISDWVAGTSHTGLGHSGFFVESAIRGPHGPAEEASVCVWWGRSRRDTFEGDSYIRCRMAKWVDFHRTIYRSLPRRFSTRIRSPVWCGAPVCFRGGAAVGFYDGGRPWRTVSTRNRRVT